MIWFDVGDDDFDDANLHEEQQPHGPVPPSPTHLQTGNTCEKNYLGFEKKKITHLLFCYPFFEANEKIWNKTDRKDRNVVGLIQLFNKNRRIVWFGFAAAFHHQLWPTSQSLKSRRTYFPISQLVLTGSVNINYVQIDNYNYFPAQWGDRSSL